MNHSINQNAIWNKQLPAFFGVLVLLATLGTTILLSRNTVTFVTKATIGSVPKNIQISTIMDSSFTVSFTTDASVVSTLSFGSDTKLGTVVLDDRDQQIGKPSEHRVHFFTVHNLKPGTTYYFSITSGAQVITDNGRPYEVMTVTALGKMPTTQDTLTGTVSLDDGAIPTEGVIYVSTETSAVIAGLLKPDGSYEVPLTQLRTKDLSKYLILSPEKKLQIQISNGSEQSKATLLANQIHQVPKIILTKDYDFTLSTEALAEAEASPSGQVTPDSDFPVFEEPKAVDSPEITTPEESQTFQDQQPLFTGNALPNAAIQLIINSDEEITANLQSDSSGRWEFRPPVSLAPGAHTITISSLNAAGIMEKISRSFTVHAQGSQFTEPSISPIDTSPTRKPTAAPTLPLPTFKPTPTATASPSPVASLTPTPQLSPSPHSSPSPTPVPISPTGSSSLLSVFLGAVTAIGVGALLFIFTAI